jgi:peroxiredoxin
MDRPRPQTPAPPLEVSLTTGDTWRLADQSPDTFTLVVFYRGYHCPVCEGYNKTLNDLLDRYEERGVEVLAVSMDTKERAQQSAEEWGLDALTVAYGLTEEQARTWGLYLSEGVKEGEPDLFSEPGLFLVRPDGTLYYSAVNTMPFGRPNLEDLLGALDFIDTNNYPPRGEVDPTVAA